MRVPFAKVQSVGNDFVLVEAADLADLDASEFAKYACRHHFSVGSDGLLVVSKEGEHLRMRMFNPDGTEDFCGNGLRCAAWYAFRKEWVPAEFTILHLDRAVPTRVGPDGYVSTQIGVASFLPSDVPHLAGEEIFERAFEVAGVDVVGSALTTGSTHLVLHVNELPEEDVFLSVSPALEYHPLFPERTSVIWTVAADDGLAIRIWERGVGETLGCGTGSSAAASAHFRRTGGGGMIPVRNKGGVVTVEMEAWDQPITTSGTAHVVYHGSLDS